jgi:proteasome accessory factor B
MFERDKDDLRNLGISIEVGSFDPLFEDEAGYRILTSSYRFQLGELSPREIAILSMAAQAWRGEALDSNALSVLIKLKSIGVESDFSSLPALAPQATPVHEGIASVMRAIATKTTISFSYYGQSLVTETRVVEPFGAGSTHGHWYIIGRDLLRKEMRVFRFDRISGDIAFQGKPSSYDIPEDFSALPFLEPLEVPSQARIAIRSAHGFDLRVRGTLANNDIKISGWDEFDISYSHEDRFIEELLWHGDNVVVLTPEHIRNRVVESLERIVAIHG